MHPLQRDGSQGAECSQVFLLLGQGEPAGVLGFDREYTPGAHRRHQRQIEQFAGRQGVGAETGRHAVVVSPLRHAHVEHLEPRAGFGVLQAAGAIG